MAALDHRGRHEQARAAERDLPRQVDTAADRDALDALGVDVDHRAEGGRVALHED